MDAETKHLMLLAWPPAMLLLLLALVLFYRRWLEGRYQTGMHIQACGFAIAVFGMAIGVYLDLVPLGARLIALGFLVGLVGAYKHLTHKK